jgi:hypothetical protein
MQQLCGQALWNEWQGHGEELQRKIEGENTVANIFAAPTWGIPRQAPHQSDSDYVRQVLSSPMLDHATPEESRISWLKTSINKLLELDKHKQRSISSNRACILEAMNATPLALALAGRKLVDDPGFIAEAVKKIHELQQAAKPPQSWVHAWMPHSLSTALSLVGGGQHPGQAVPSRNPGKKTRADEENEICQMVKEAFADLSDDPTLQAIQDKLKNPDYIAEVIAMLHSADQDQHRD